MLEESVLYMLRIYIKVDEKTHRYEDKYDENKDNLWAWYEKQKDKNILGAELYIKREDDDLIPDYNFLDIVWESRWKSQEAEEFVGRFGWLLKYSTYSKQK